ncbi:MAG: pyridoxine 5'-phosphate synthase [Nitrospirae bacterium]|nr:pyridoxine 5'-phosphate synthase [Nitrospirota bacterium]
MTRLGVNIDHVATVRQARGGVEPEPVAAAILAETAGADGIVCHLREDRRHIQDRDLELLRKIVTSHLNLEMAAVNEMVKIASKIHPDLVTLVPERREELTTEGGLDVIKQESRLKKVIKTLHENDIEVSIFIDPDTKQIESALETGAKIIEIHTGRYANASTRSEREKELEKIVNATLYAREIGLKVSAGHGLNYKNVTAIADIKEIEELNIGHSIISRALFVGMEAAVREMKKLISNSK